MLRDGCHAVVVAFVLRLLHFCQNGALLLLEFLPFARNLVQVLAVPRLSRPELSVDIV